MSSAVEARKEAKTATEGLENKEKLLEA